MYAAQTEIWLLNGSNNSENTLNPTSPKMQLFASFIRLLLPGKLHAHSVFIAVWYKFEVSR